MESSKYQPQSRSLVRLHARIQESQEHETGEELRMKEGEMVKGKQKVAGSRSSQVMPRVPQEAEHQQKSIMESEVLHFGRYGQQCHC